MDARAATGVPRLPRRRMILALAAAASIALLIMAAALLAPWLRPTTGRTVATPILPTVVVHDPVWQRARAPEEAEIDAFAARLRAALARFDDLFVIAAEQAPGRDAGGPLHYALRLLVSGPVERPMLLIRAEHVASGLIVWSSEAEILVSGPGSAAARDAFLRQVATSLAQPYGVLFSHLRLQFRTPQAAAQPYACILESFEYWRSYGRAAHAEASRCLDAALATNPTLAGLHAQRSTLLLEEYRNLYVTDGAAVLDRALVSAQRAVALAPASARAQQAMLAAAFSRREFDRAWQAAERALALNPYDTDILADVGARYVQAGRTTEGVAMIDRAIAANPVPPAWAMTYKAIGHVALDQGSVAASVIRQTVASQFPLAMYGRVLEAYYSGMPAAIAPRLEALRALHPEIEADPAAYLDRLVIDPPLRDRLLQTLAEARKAAAAAAEHPR